MTLQNRFAAEALATGTLAGLPDGHFIDGRFVSPASGAFLHSDDPGHGRPFARFAAGNAEDVDRAVAGAARAFDLWRRVPPAERGRILMRIAAAVRENADRLAVAESLDAGKRLSEAEGDIRSVVRTFEYYAGAADKLEGTSLTLGPDYQGFTMLEPVGVTAQIIPWNYPVSTMARGIAPALAAGCTAVVKPAETTPFSALLLAEICHDAGLPPGVLNVVAGTGREAGAPLVGDPRIAHITFTGSVPTGIGVMKAAADNVTRLVLELGGKSPLVVLADADLDAAVDGILGAIFENAGQICSAGSRLLVARPVAEAVLERVAARAKAMRLGHGLSAPDVGPVNSALHLSRIAAHVDRARADGCQILSGGDVVHPKGFEGGWYFAPTVALAPTPATAIARDEVFGPVLAALVIDDLDEAVAVANSTDFALAAGIYTANLTSAYRFARDVDAGQVYINEYFSAGIEAPFGGNRKSGFGREKGIEGIRSYCKVKSVVARI